MKKICLLVSLCLVLFSAIPLENLQAQSEFKYKSVAYMETDLLGGYNPCVWIATECTNEKGSSCTLPGSKARGLVYCALPTLINFK